MPHGLFPGGGEEEISIFVGFPDEILKRLVQREESPQTTSLKRSLMYFLQNFSGEAGAEDEKVLADGVPVSYRTLIASSSAENAFFTRFSGPESTGMEAPFDVPFPL